MIERLQVAPLVPLALAATAGVCLDRWLAVPLPLALTFAAVAALVWWRRRDRSLDWRAWLVLGFGVAGAGAAHHGLQLRYYAADDIGEFASEQPRLVQLTATVAEGVQYHPVPPTNALVSVPRLDSSTAILDVTDCSLVPSASGRLRLTSPGSLGPLRVGDEVNVTGWLSRPRGPLNPGEFDGRAALLDQRIRAELRVRHTSDTVIRTAAGWTASVGGWLAATRGWARDTLSARLPEREAGLAAALLLGDNAALDSSEWEKFVRTGVVHVLAISGQHLVILGGFLWFVFRQLRIRSRRAAVIIAGLLFGYALLTGGRPAALRAAVLVGLVAGAAWLRRTPMPANLFAAAWLVVLVLNPADLFTAGCQLSFLAVAVLIWLVAPLLQPGEVDPLDRLLAASRPRFVRASIVIGKWLGQAYLVTLLVQLALTPLLIHWQNVVSPAGLLLGPPLVALTSVALIAGFLLFVAELVGGWLSPVLAPFTSLPLRLSDWLVNGVEQWPGAYLYVGNLPLTSLVLFYLMLTSALFTGGWRRRVCLLASALVVLLPLLIPNAARSGDSLRVTFLAVGHGNCTVLELPDGRTVLYDAGTLGGPEVAARVIAPFLWSRDIRRIDELMVSHADLDHFNGGLGLLRRFPVGRVTLTPSFAAKATPGVRRFLDEWTRRGIPVRTVSASDRLDFGTVAAQVLHPPAEGPPGPENVRSLVLHLRHAAHTILLTGDLEAAGADLVLRRPISPVDVVLSPHHGSRGANTTAFAEWCQPLVLVASQAERDAEPYPGFRERGGWLFATPTAGAVTVTSGPGGLSVGTWGSQQSIALPLRVRPE